MFVRGLKTPLLQVKMDNWGIEMLLIDPLKNHNLFQFSTILGMFFSVFVFLFVLFFK